MGRLIKALLGALGIIHYQKKWKEKATWDKFIMSCKKALRPNEYLVSFILTCDVTPEFMSGGISGATGSGWQHALVCLWDQGDYGGIGYTEIVESQALVEINDLKKYNRDDMQLAAFSVSLESIDFIKLKKNLYSQLGKPYDVAEFLRYLRGVFDVLPNSKDIHVCSTLATYSVKGVLHRWFGRYEPLRLVKKKVNPDFCVPGDIYNGCYPQFRYRVSKFHW